MVAIASCVILPIVRKQPTQVKAVEWPAMLKSVHFGDRFHKSLKGVRWPQGLERVVLGEEFDSDLSKAAWPASLKELTVPSEAFLGDDRSNIPASCIVKFLFDAYDLEGELA